MELFSIFKPFPELVTVFSEKKDGDMKLRDMAPENLERRKRFFAAHGIEPEAVVGVLAVHGADVIRVGRREAGAVMKHTDGLVTNETGVFLAVTAADCLALYIYDPVEKIVALVHAGWRGLARGIISKALRQFPAPERVRVAVSPFIQAHHFEVGSEVLEVFGAYPEALALQDGKTFIDLGVIALRQLLEAGVKSEYTEVSSQCTACLAESYFSYRRDKPELKVMVAVIGIQK